MERRNYNFIVVLSLANKKIYAEKGQVFGDGESATLYLAFFSAILLLGPGKASFDKFIGK